LRELDKKNFNPIKKSGAGGANLECEKRLKSFSFLFYQHTHQKFNFSIFLSYLSKVLGTRL